MDNYNRSNRVRIILNLILVLILLATPKMLASEISSGEGSEVLKESKSAAEIVNLLDVNQEYEDYIDVDELKYSLQSSVKISHVESREDMSVINSSIVGPYSVYKVNGHFVFCIEPGDSTLSIGTVSSQSNSKFSKFSTKTKQYLERVASTAINYYTATGNVDYIFAGQLLYWEYLSANEADVIGNPFGDYKPDFLTSWTIHNSKVYNSEIKTIEKDVANWEVIPSFLGTSSTNAPIHTLKYNPKTDDFSVILTDSNHVWDDKYANYEDFGQYKLTNPEGNDNLKITASKEMTSASSPHRFVWVPSINGKNEVYDGGQELIYIGPKQEVSYIRFKTSKKPTGGFKLTKLGSSIDGVSVPLGGVKFEVTSSTYPDYKHVFTTDSAGLIKTGDDELLLGDYHISEIDAPVAYDRGYEQDFKVSSSNQIVDINEGKPIVNETYVNKVHLTKVGNDNLLADAQFAIYKDSGQTAGQVDEGDQLMEQLITDENGSATSSDLGIGEYLVIETQAPIGYLLDPTPYPFTITNTHGNQGQVIELGPIENQKINGAIELYKVGTGPCTSGLEQICDTELSDVSFGIYKDLNANKIIDDDELSTVVEITTDASGYAAENNLSYGDYLVVELANPNQNYQLSSEVFPFSITEDQQLVKLNNAEPIVNEQKVGSITIRKLSSSPGEDNQLADAEFTLFDSDDKILTSAVTDEEGILNFSSLPFGDYSIKETRAPQGYLLNDEIIEFSISEKNYKQPSVVEVVDKPITNKIEISKTDVETGEELPGATLRVIDKSDNKVIEQWVSTTKSHNFEVAYGDYKICEKLAPDGYKRSTKCTDFEVRTEGVIQKFEVTNKRVLLAVTGASNLTLIWKICLILIIIFFIKLYLIVNRKKLQIKSK